jgi:serine protease
VTTGAALGTFLIANDGDGWDPDPADPGDWISSSDLLNALFPPASCGSSATPPGPVDSSWHGTRVLGVLGALTGNGIGIAGITWKPYLLPVRALGKCGGYDSDIIAGMQWAAGMPVTGVPDNPYPADIINLSLGASGACPSSYAAAVPTLTAMGVLIVVSAGNEGGPVDAPGNCAGVLAVAGLRNVGTKVAFSSLGPEVSIAAPAGNCVNGSGACLRSIETTVNDGLTVPTINGYTNQTQSVNLGTSFSAPIVSGIAALMRAVNDNLTPALLIARIKSSATTFPQPIGTAVCSAATADPNNPVECACPTDGSQCGAGMVNALSAVNAALRPIAAIAMPATVAAGSNATFDAGGSVASCGRSVVSYAWTAAGGVTLQSAANTASVTVAPSGAAGTLTLTVTDSTGATDSAVVRFSASGGSLGASTTAPATAGSSASACPTEMPVTLAVPTVTESFAPASVGENVVSTLTITLGNSNAFALTESSLTQALPANLTIAAATATVPSPATTCSGAALSLTNTSSAVTLTGAVIPAKGSCSITIPVTSATAASYTSTVAANALSTGPAGSNSAAATATLTVTAPSKGGGGLDWLDMLFVTGVLLAGRRRRPVSSRAQRRP